jgi:hypothetical protein
LFPCYLYLPEQAFINNSPVNVLTNRTGTF